MTGKWRDMIQRELMRPDAGPASENFYRGVWRRIEARSASEARGRQTLVYSFGRVCWKSVPIFVALLLVLSFWMWYSPPNLRPDIMGSSESFVLDAEDAPSNTSLLYQIMYAAPVSESENQ